MKADAARIQAIARQWHDGVRLVLLHGADNAASRDLADQIARQFADISNPMAVASLIGASLTSDPQALVAAASAMSMFGDRTLVFVDGLTEDCLDAISALVATPAGNPVVAVAGAFKKGSKLLAFAEKSPAIESLVSYEPTARDAFRLVGEIATVYGLRPSRDAAMAVFESAGGDRMIMRQEIEKLALYLDASPEQQRPMELTDVAAVGVGAGESDQYALVTAVASGRPAVAAGLLARQTVAGIVVLRALERRLTMLLGLRAAVDAGASPRSVVEGARPPIFWKEKDAVMVELGLWQTPMLARGLASVLAAERAIKTSGSLGETMADAAILELAQVAASGRR